MTPVPGEATMIRVVIRKASVMGLSPFLCTMPQSMFRSTLDTIPTSWYGVSKGRDMPETQPRHDSKTRILDAAMHVIRSKGYSAATIDDVCAAAGLTKG